jgi:hypothetical protein
VGDVAFDEVSDVASFLTPVPGKKKTKTKKRIKYFLHIGESCFTTGIYDIDEQNHVSFVNPHFGL